MQFIDCGIKAYLFTADGYYLLSNRQSTYCILLALIFFLKRFHLVCNQQMLTVVPFTLQLPDRAEVVPYPTDLPLLSMHLKSLPDSWERDQG